MDKNEQRYRPEQRIPVCQELVQDETIKTFTYRNSWISKSPIILLMKLLLVARLKVDQRYIIRFNQFFFSHSRQIV